ncbi:MAG TPA: hypothetical protein ENF89_00645 [Candidatus Bathyarchaeota archaeon]|nr:hypothetical protein [Candidatus Bathyarchaeota archaeon]
MNAASDTSNIRLKPPRDGFKPLEDLQVIQGALKIEFPPSMYKHIWMKLSASRGPHTPLNR